MGASVSDLLLAGTTQLVDLYDYMATLRRSLMYHSRTSRLSDWLLQEMEWEQTQDALLESVPEAPSLL